MHSRCSGVLSPAPGRAAGSGSSDTARCSCGASAAAESTSKTRCGEEECGDPAVRRRITRVATAAPVPAASLQGVCAGRHAAAVAEATLTTLTAAGARRRGQRRATECVIGSMASARSAAVARAAVARMPFVAADEVNIDAICTATAVGACRQPQSRLQHGWGEQPDGVPACAIRASGLPRPRGSRQVVHVHAQGRMPRHAPHVHA